MAVESALLRVIVQADTGSAERDLNSFSGRMAKAGQDMAKAGAALSLGLTAPLLAVGQQALTMAGDFEQSMSVLQSVTGATADTMSGLSQQALDLGATTVFSAGEAADAMLELGKAGLETQEITDSISGVMALAAAGQIELGEAAAITAGALNAFGLEASESTRIADMLAAAANASAADMHDLAIGFKQAGFAFSLTNQPIENLATSLALLTNVGLSGSDAGTALKNAFMRMMNPTDKAKNLMDELGLTFYDAEGNMKMMQDTVDATGNTIPGLITSINTALTGLSDQQRDAALATIFLSDGMKAMVPILEQGNAGFMAMQEQVNEVGAAGRVADAFMGGLNGAIEYLSGSVESFLIGAALPFLDFLNEMIRNVADGITWIGELPRPVLDAAIAFGIFLAAIGPTLLILGAVTTALASPLLPIAALVLAIGGLAAAWVTDLGGIKTTTLSALEPVVDKFNEVTDGIGAFIDYVKNAVSSSNALHSSLVEVPKMLQPIANEIAIIGIQIPGVLDKIEAAFKATKFPTLRELVGDFVAGDWIGLQNTIKTTAIDLMVNLDTELNITGRANELREQLVQAISGMVSAASKMDFSTAQTSFEQLRLNIQLGLRNAIETIDIASAFESLTGIDPGPYRKILDELSMGIRDGLHRLVTASTEFNPVAALASFQATADSLRDGILSTLTTAVSTFDWAAASQSLAGLIDGLALVVKTLDLSKIDWMGFIQRIILGPLGVALSAANWIVESEEFDPLVTAVSDAIAAIKWDDLGTSLVGFNTTVAEKLDAAFVDMINGVSASITAVDWEKASWDFSKLIDSLTETLKNQNWAGMGSGLVSTIFDAFRNAFTPTERSEETNQAFIGLKDSILKALTDIDWKGIDQSFINLGSAIDQAVKSFFMGIVTQLGLEFSALGLSLPTFNWSEFVPNIVWSDWIPDLGWNEAIPTPLDWVNYVTSINWGSYISALSWDSFVTTTLEWEDYLESLDWVVFISDLSWSSFVSSLTWSSFIPDVDWEDLVDDIDWGDFIPDIDWGDWLAGISGFGGGGGDDGGGGGGGNDTPEGAPYNPDQNNFDPDDYGSIGSISSVNGGAQVIYLTIPIQATIANTVDIKTLAAEVAKEFKRRIG